MTTPANTPAASAASATPPAAPLPGTPEYNAAMIAAYDGQVPGGTAAGEPPKPAEVTPPVVPPVDGAKPADAGTTTETPPADPSNTDPATAEGTEGSGPTLASFLEDSLLGEQVRNTGKLDDAALKKLEGFGIPSDIAQTVAAALKAQSDLLVQNLHTAAGGKEAFESLTKWGTANLPEHERAFLNNELNGPNYQAALDLLKLRHQRATGADPSLFQPNGGAAPKGAQGYANPGEQSAAINDPRYQYDASYRAEVMRRMAATKFS